MNIVLPPGSTSADLQAAIDDAASGDVIILSGDMPFTATGEDTDTVTIPEGKEITIQSDTGNNWVMSQTYYLRHFDVSGSLILQNITLDGGNKEGGVNVDTGGNFTMNNGAVIQNCISSYPGFWGGGVQVDAGGNFTMNNGAIIQNSTSGLASAGGGAVCIMGGTVTMNGGIMRGNTGMHGGAVRITRENGAFTMSGGTISGNFGQVTGGGLYSDAQNAKVVMTGGAISDNQASYGGGVCLVSTDFTMSGGVINDNIAADRGGGFCLFSTSSVTMSGGIINANQSNSNGGAFYLETGSNVVNITGESYITNNSAPNGYGGGFFVEGNAYRNLTTGSKTVFSCNSAAEAYNPPEDASTLYPNIQFASTSITNHLLNNYDINYTDSEPTEERLHVTYNANGGTGSHIGPETMPGNTDIVLSAAAIGIGRIGYTPTDWNTEPDGSGTSYAPGDTIILNCSPVLYAQWIADPVFYTVTYGANGGNGSYIDPGREYDLNYIILSTIQTGINRKGFLFTGWNTRPDGSGTSYASGDIIVITADIGLYAQWGQISAQKRLCRAPVTKCRTAIEGQKLWVDNDNSGNMRPPSVEIILLRDGEVYKRTDVDSTGDGYFGFCCLPVWKNSSQKYIYRIDETAVPGYTKTIEGFNVINTLSP